MKTPLFSIITICYNSARTIERTIKSVLAQTFTDYEYIIVDGASKDNTLEIVNQYKDAFGDKIRIISEPDKGIYDAMNKGIKLSQGTIIGIVNSDDWLEPDALHIVYDAYVENCYSQDCLFTGGIRFHKDTGCQTLLMPDLERFKRKAKSYQMAGIRHPATFVCKKVYDEVGLFDSEMLILADTDFILRCYYNGYQIVPIDRVISNMADGGVSNQLTWKVGKRSFRDKKRSLSKFKMSPLYRTCLILHSIAIIVTKRTIFRFFIKHS